MMVRHGGAQIPTRLKHHRHYTGDHCARQHNSPQAEQADSVPAAFDARQGRIFARARNTKFAPPQIKPLMRGYIRLLTFEATAIDPAAHAQHPQLDALLRHPQYTMLAWRFGQSKLYITLRRITEGDIAVWYMQTLPRQRA